MDHDLGLDGLTLEQQREVYEARTEEPARGIIFALLWCVVFWLGLFDLISWLAR